MPSGSMAMKQKTQALRQVRMPSNSTSEKARPQSWPGPRSRVQAQASSEPSSPTTATSRSTEAPSASQRQVMMSSRGTPFTASTRMPGSSPASHAGLPSSTEATQAPSTGSSWRP